MGYTNYFKYPPPTRRAAQLVIDDVKRLQARSSVPVALEVHDDHFTLNGIGEDAYERMVWPQAPDCVYPSGQDYTDDLVKTDRRDYDALVFAAMLSIKHHIPAARLKTDDCASLEHLVDALQSEYGDRGCASVVEWLAKMRWNEFSPMHQSGIALYQATFPDRDVCAVLPWEPAI